MIDSFEATLASIKTQESSFETQEERAVEIGAVLPLLRELGWNTENVTEVYPQHGLPGGSKVDYDLQIDGESRILIEVKRWTHTLDEEDEEQLANYCRLAKPTLAVLTSGCSWQLYLPPTRGKKSPLRRFHGIDITSASPTEVEGTFRRFLARDSMVNPALIIKEARKLQDEMEAYRTFKQRLTEAWSELASDDAKLAKLILEFAESNDIAASEDKVNRFLESIDSPLVNEVSTKTKPMPKPASFSLLANPNGKNKMLHQVRDRGSWNKFFLEFCELMKDRHREEFRQNVLSMTDWFSESEHSQFVLLVDEGLFAKKSAVAKQIRDACYEIVTKFGYPKDSLEIKDSKDTIL